MTNVTRIPTICEWKGAHAWLDGNFEGNPAYIFNLSRAPDLHRTMRLARERMLGYLALLKAAGMANDTPVDIDSEIVDLKEQVTSFAFDEQVGKKYLKLKKTNDSPF